MAFPPAGNPDLIMAETLSVHWHFSRLKKTPFGISGLPFTIL